MIEKNHIRKSRVIRGRIGSIILYVLAVFFLISTIGYLVALGAVGPIAPVIATTILFLCFTLLFFFLGFRISRRIYWFKQYITLISKDMDLSFNNLSATTNRPFAKFAKDMNVMIIKGYFVDMQLDYIGQKLIFTEKPIAAATKVAAAADNDTGVAVEHKTVCSGCGANTVLQGSGPQYCEYCGNKLS